MIIRMLATGCLTAGFWALAFHQGIAQEGHRSTDAARAPFSSPLAALGGSVYGQAVGVTSIVFGPEPKGKPEIILFTGLLEITKSPVKFLASGRRQIEVKFDSRSPTGARVARQAITTLGFVEVWVDPDPNRQSVGTITEIHGHPHEAGHGHAELFLVFKGGTNFQGPDFGELRNREPIVLTGHIHSIPPITSPIKLSRTMTPDELIKAMEEVGDADKWVGANPYPIPLFDSSGVAQAWFTPYVHVTTLTGTCGDGVDNDLDGRIDEEGGHNQDLDGDGFADEDSKCPQ
jgi:hypothetical protein